MNMNTSDFSPLKFDRKRSRVKTCPCGKSNLNGKFVPYQGFEDKGYCHSCEKTFLPELEREQTFKPVRERKAIKPPSYVSLNVLRASMKGYERNNFVQFLVDLFGPDTTTELIGKYFVGSTRNGHAIFWQVDIAGRIRSGKVMRYDNTGHRLKDQPADWVHTQLKLKDYELRQCLFGEHLLKGNTLPCAIVESEKTAIIGSLYFPRIVWLACGGKDGLKIEKMQALRGRNVILYPDLDGFELWSRKAQELAPMLNITVSDLLERKATAKERECKLDIADYLLRFPVSEFQQPATQELTQSLGPDYHNERLTTIPWEFFECKPISMAMISIEDYRNNGWRLPDNFQEIQNKRFSK